MLRSHWRTLRVVRPADRSVDAFEVHQSVPYQEHRAHASHVIDAQHARRSSRADRPSSQQRIGADRYASLMRQASATFAAGLQRERCQQLGGFVRAPGVTGQHTIEALGKDSAWAVRRITEPPTAVDFQPHRVAAPWQIQRAPKIAAVLTPTQFATLRARDGLARRFGNQDQTPVMLHDHQRDFPVLWTLHPATRPSTSPFDGHASAIGLTPEEA